MAIEAAALGLFFLALFFFVRASRSLRDPRYLSLAAIALIAGLYSLAGMSAKTAFFGGAEEGLVGRLIVAQEAVLPFFLYAIPAMLAAFVKAPAALNRANRLASWIMLALAAASALAAVIFPRVYLYDFKRLEGGMEVYAGWNYFAAHAPVGVAAAYAVAVLLADVLRWKNLGQEIFFFIGTFLAGMFAVSSVWRMLFGAYIDPLRAFAFSRVMASLLLFGAIISIGFIRRFLGEAGETRAAKERADSLLVKDPLTGLPNRRAFAADAERARAKDGGRGLALALLDIDGFLDLNESYGSATGDKLLAALGPAISEALGGLTVYRMGGDEFAFMIPCDGDAGAGRAEQAVKLAREVLRRGLAAEPGTLFKLDSSAAIAFMNKPEESPEASLANAYTCLREAKREGNAVKVFTPEWHRATLERIETVLALRSDLESGKLRLEYQPIHDAEGRLTGAEALLRWDRARMAGGPGAFIPLAESAGLMPSIGRRIMGMLLDDLGAALRAGGLPPISINLSPIQLMEADCCAAMEELVGSYDLSLSLFQFEVTESIFLGRGTQAVDSLRRLRERGARVAIDDFGSGYSNLGYLGSLPADKIKVDKSFIDSVPGDPKAESLVRALAEIGRSFGLELLIEGVENTAQFAFLKGAGYREFQGFLFSRPLRPEALIRYAREFAGADPRSPVLTRRAPV